MRLTQIVPALPPRHEGIGGFAMALAYALRALGVETTFVYAGASNVDFAVAQPNEIPAGQPVLLHYANYGYSVHGTPTDLVGQLTRAKQGGHVPRLAVYFHEFVATGPPWRRAFWTTNTQRRLARQLALASESALTTIPVYEDLLRSLAPELRTQRLAMPSPVGAALKCPAVKNRSAQAIVFGGPGNRAAVYSGLHGVGEDLAAAGVEGILDVGPQPSLAPSHIAGLQVEARGEVSAADLSSILLATRLGFAAYPADFLGKSTAFAALAAHGVPCLALTEPKIARVDAPCLRRGERLDEERLDEVGRAVRAWYEGHDLATHVDAVLAAVGLAT